ncbi:MAG: hypothetical protein ACKVXR_16530 [Planctomycetota bacterium]
MLARRVLQTTIGLLAPFLLGRDAWAQQGSISFSIDWQGPSVGLPSSTPGIPLTEGDILLPASGQPAFGPSANPQIFRNGGQLGLTRYPFCVGHQGGTPCGIEVDAISYGNDDRFLLTSLATRVYFSVEERAAGHPGSVLTPSVRSEGTLTGVHDISADVFVALMLPPGPLPPGGAPPENVGVLDGNGLISGSGAKYRGLGLREPNAPTIPPDAGDNLDALALGALPGPNGRVYFSLDSCFSDPFGFPNSCSAQFQGVEPGAILRKDLAGGLTVFALASQLGLDLAGPGMDDLDALILWDNGDGIYQPALAPYDWVDGSSDMLIFSVRRGSQVVGQSDSIFGIPIMPSDLLLPPFPGAASLLGPGKPGVFIAGENLGLSTSRAGGGGLVDELDAGASKDEPVYDCNGNGVEDSVDIAKGSSPDANGNSIPDECEITYSTYCACSAGSGPCGNDDPSAGCANSTGVGALLSSTGTTSYEEDDLVLTATQLPANKLGIWLMAAGQTFAPLGDGIRCVSNPFKRYGSFNSGAGGTGSKGPGLVANSCATLPAAYCIGPASTWNFQVWYRNAAGPCGTGTNLTNGLNVTWTP